MAMAIGHVAPLRVKSPLWRECLFLNISIATISLDREEVHIHDKVVNLADPTFLGSIRGIWGGGALTLTRMDYLYFPTGEMTSLFSLLQFDWLLSSSRAPNKGFLQQRLSHCCTIPTASLWHTIPHMYFYIGYILPISPFPPLKSFCSQGIVFSFVELYFFPPDQSLKGEGGGTEFVSMYIIKLRHNRAQPFLFLRPVLLFPPFVLKQASRL